MRMKKKLVILLLTASLLALLCGCAGGSGTAQTPAPEPEQTEPAGQAPAPETTPEPAAPAEPTPEPEPETPAETPDAELDDPRRDWEPIETKFGRLRYPDDFYGYLSTEQTETDEGLRVLFTAVIGDKRIDLFEIAIGNGEGEPVGTLTGPDGTVRDVFLRFIEIEDLEGLSEGETNRVYAMQESLNYVIDNLR